MARAVAVPDWVTYPEEEWVTISPAEAGLDAGGFERFLSGLDVRGASFAGEDHGGTKWGVVLTRGGYLVQTWGDRHYRFQTASVGKAFAFALVGLAVADGLIEPDDLISETWTGRGELSHPHKYLDEGHHRTLTWRLLIGNKYGSKTLRRVPHRARISLEEGRGTHRRGEGRRPEPRCPQHPVVGDLDRRPLLRQLLPRGSRGPSATTAAGGSGVWGRP